MLNATFGGIAVLQGCYERHTLLALYAGFAACGGTGMDLKPCDPAPAAFPGLPQIYSISPLVGPPGTQVTVSGVHFNQLDDRYQAAYGDFSIGCGHATLDGSVISDTEIQITIPEDAGLSGYIYLVAEGLTVTRAPQRFELEASAVITVLNESQFPIASVEAAWQPLLEPGERIDIEQAHEFSVSDGPVHLEICAGDAGSTQVEKWACMTFDGRVTPGSVTAVTVPKFPAAQFVAGDWVATWMVGEEEVAEEQLRIDRDGYWELRYNRRVVESGMLVERPWAPYVRDFEFALRPEDPMTEARVPVRSFSVLSARAGGQVTFYRPE